MVRHDHPHSRRLGGLDAVVGADSAVTSQKELRPQSARDFDRAFMDAIAFFDAVGHVGLDPHADAGEEAVENGRAGDTVDVVVAVDEDKLASLLGAQDLVPGMGVVGQQARVVKVVEAGMEETLRFSRVGNAALNEKGGDDVGDAQLAFQDRFRRGIAFGNDPFRGLKSGWHQR